MSYIKDKTIIDFLFQVETLIQGLNTKFEPIYYFTLGHTWQSSLQYPKELSSILESFSLLHQYEEFQAISNSQRNKLFLDLLVNPQANLEQKLADLTSAEQEESKQVEQSQSNSASAKERRQKCIELFDKTEMKLAEHLALTEEDARLSPIDLVMWGFFVAHLQARPFMTHIEAQTDNVFEKILTVRQAEMSAILTHNQKMRVFIKLYNDWELDLNESFAKLLENPTLGSKPLSSLIVPEEKINEIMLQQLALEEKFEQEKARVKREKQDNEGVFCNICLLDLYEKDEDVYFMDICVHSYHESCLSDYLQHQVKERKFPVKCPDESCREEFSGADLKELLTEENVEKFYELAFEEFIKKNGKDMTYCPTPDCTYAFFLNPDLTTFECPNCLKDYCLKCKNRLHKGSCGDHGFIELAEYLSYKPCPSCKFWIEKTEGCDHMTCNCGFEFCYNCGNDWKGHVFCSYDRYTFYHDYREQVEDGERVEHIAQNLYIKNRPVNSYNIMKRYNMDPQHDRSRYLLQGTNRKARVQKKKGKR